MQVTTNINLQTKQEQSSEWHVNTDPFDGSGRKGCSVTRACQTNPGVPHLWRSISVSTARELALTNSPDGGGKSADVVANFTD